MYIDVCEGCEEQIYDSIAVSHGGRTVVLTPTTLVIIEGNKFAAYCIRSDVQLELLNNPSDTPLLFVPEPGVAPNGFMRKMEDGNLCAEKMTSS